jgi:nucleotide-binding universal stress UspA family protein
MVEVYHSNPGPRAGVNMYSRILLAYDGSVEGRTALREGAILARQCGAQVFLLSVLADIGMLLMSEVTSAGATVQMEEEYQEILNEGVARLKRLGFDPIAKLVRGQPAEEIGKYAREVGADLIVVGHRRQSAFDRWWSGPNLPDGLHRLQSSRCPQRRERRRHSGASCC